MNAHRVSLNVSHGRPGGDAIHVFVAGAPWQLAALLPHLNRANALRGFGYYFVDYYAASTDDCESAAADLQENWLVGRTTVLELGPRLAHLGLGYPGTPVVSLFDSPRMTAHLVQQARDGGRHALGYLTVTLSHAVRFGLQFAVAPEDIAAHGELQALLGSLAKLGDRHGVEEVFGCHAGQTEAETDHTLFREFALHLERNATSVLDHGRTTTPAIQRVLGGRVTTVANVESLVASLTALPATARSTVKLENAA